jgi:hypothetical protein
MKVDKGDAMAQVEHHHHDAFPDDLLDFLPADDETGERSDRSAEELALRSVPDSLRAPLDDPALREDSSDVDELSPASWFEDEQPEPPYRSPQDDEEASVDDLLVAQHYAFEGDSDASDETSAESGVDEE